MTETQLPRFASYAAKEQAILDWKDHYARGMAVAFTYCLYDDEGKHCVMGLAMSREWAVEPALTISSPYWLPLARANDTGNDFSSGSLGAPVTPEGYAAVLDLLQRCGVGE